MNEIQYIQKTEKGDIMFSTVSLSCSDYSIKWFIHFLEGDRDKLKYEGNKKYEIQKYSLNSFILKETREGKFVNEIIFSENEIPNILDKIKSILNENKD